MVLRCPTCGFVNQMADAETAFCPNCGNPYITAAIGNDAMVAAAPSYVPAASYAPFPARTPYPTQVPTWNDADSQVGFRPPSPLPPRRRTRMGSFVTGMAVALGIVVLAICSLAALAAAKKNANTSTAQTATATPVMTVSATAVPTQTFTDPAGYFSISYPTSWQVSTAPANSLQGQGTAFASTTGATKVVEILVTPTLLTTSSLPLAIASSGGTGYVETHAPISITIGTIHWRKVEGNYTTADGAAYHATEFVTRHGVRTFVVVLTASQVEYKGAYRAIFLPMLVSFTFAK